MRGGKYMDERINNMRKSNARVSSGIIMRTGLLLAILVLGWFSCNFTLKFVEDHPELDCTRTEKPGEFYDARHR